MNITIDRPQALYLLEALRVCEKQWLQASRASNDNDLQADYGNSLLRLHLVQEYLEKEAVAAFGEDVTVFSHHEIVSATPNNGKPELHRR